MKLLQMDTKLALLKPGTIALELGAAPGSWTQVLTQKRMRVFALDELPMDPLPGCTFVRGSIVSEESRRELLLLLNGEPVDLVLSDISPSRSGHHSCVHSALRASGPSLVRLSRSRCKRLQAGACSPRPFNPRALVPVPPHRLDHCRLISLLVDVMGLARQVIRPGGSVLVKALHGEDHPAFIRTLRRFSKVSEQKPKASRSESVRAASCA
jgi:23S rRNA (uridine2552-2'-O)-methyltransferase